MLSIKNEGLIRDSGHQNLALIRAAIPAGSEADHALEEAMNLARSKPLTSDEEDDLREEMAALSRRISSLSDTNEAQRGQLRTAAEALAKETDRADAAEKCYSEALDLSVKLQEELDDARAKGAAALWLVPGDIPLGQLRDYHRAFAADFAELERLRKFEAVRLEQDARMAEEKAANPAPDQAGPSAEIPDEMFEQGPIKSTSVAADGALSVEYYHPDAFARYVTPDGEVRLQVKDMTPEQKAEFDAHMEAIKAAPNQPIQFAPMACRKRLDGIARRANEIADGPCKPTDLRRLADLVAMLANAAAPK